MTSAIELELLQTARDVDELADLAFEYAALFRVPVAEVIDRRSPTGQPVRKLGK
jgi:DNA-binding XRE family transcriptional regulator